MTRGVLAAAVNRLDPIDLAELDARAQLLARRDRKYLMPLVDAAQFIEALPKPSRVLAIDGLRTFAYESVYFDTPDRRSFLSAAWRRPNRFKVRTRSYLDAGRCQLEIKTRDPRGWTVKQRRDHALAGRTQLDAQARAFVLASEPIGDDGDRLEPALTTRYSRSTILLEADRARATIDVDLRAWTPDGRSVALDGMAVVETKTRGRPSEADRILWQLGHRPERVSKFCTSLAAIDPGLPSNKWDQALRRPWIVSPVQPLARAG